MFILINASTMPWKDILQKISELDRLGQFAKKNWKIRKCKNSKGFSNSEMSLNLGFLFDFATIRSLDNAIWIINFRILLGNILPVCWQRRKIWTSLRYLFPKKYSRWETPHWLQEPPIWIPPRGWRKKMIESFTRWNPRSFGREFFFCWFLPTNFYICWLLWQWPFTRRTRNFEIHGPIPMCFASWIFMSQTMFGWWADISDTR